MNDFYKIVGENMNKIRTEKGLSLQYVADKIDMTKKTIQRYEQGENKIDIRKLKDIAEALGSDVASLMKGTEDDIGINIPNPEIKRKRIPVIGYVAAGNPLYMDEQIVDYVEPIWEDREHYFTLRVSSDSMKPEIKKGDDIVVEKTAFIKNGDIGVVVVNGDEATVKKIKYDDKGITLTPLNIEKYEPMTYSPEEIENLPVTVLGKVVKVIRNY